MHCNRGITSHSDKYRQKEIKPGDMLVRAERTRDIYTGGRKGGYSEKVTFELRSKQWEECALIASQLTDLPPGVEGGVSDNGIWLQAILSQH